MKVITTLLLVFAIGIALFLFSNLLHLWGLDLPTILTIYGAVLGIAMFIKVWIACGHIRDIRDQLEADANANSTRFAEIRDLLKAITELGKDGACDDAAGGGEARR